MEAGLLAATGSVAGIFGALGYAWLIMFGLRTWWVGAVGTTLLELHASWFAIAAGVAGGAFAGLLTISIRCAHSGASPRALSGGDVTQALNTRTATRVVPRRRCGAHGHGRAPLLVLAAANRINDAAGSRRRARCCSRGPRLFCIAWLPHPDASSAEPARSP